MVSKINDTKYLLYVALPRNYDVTQGKSYPVAYFTDATDGFGLATDIYRSLVRDLPEMIVVGIAYDVEGRREFSALRNRDLTPTRSVERERERTERLGFEVRTGEAERFLSVIRDEINPLVDEAYSTNNDNTYVGVSLGGLFGFYTLLHHTDVFERYLLGSPSLFWDSEVMFSQEAEYASSYRDLEARLYMSAGSLESDLILPPTTRMAQILQSRNYRGLDLSFEIIEGENHLSVTPFSYSKGLRALFSDYD